MKRSLEQSYYLTFFLLYYMTNTRTQKKKIFLINLNHFYCSIMNLFCNGFLFSQFTLLFTRCVFTSQSLKHISPMIYMYSCIILKMLHRVLYTTQKKFCCTHTFLINVLNENYHSNTNPGMIL